MKAYRDTSPQAKRLEVALLTSLHLVVEFNKASGFFFSPSLLHDQPISFRIINLSFGYSLCLSVSTRVSSTSDTDNSKLSRDVDEICALLWYYATSNGNPLPTFRDNLSVIFKNQEVSEDLDFLTLEYGTDTLSRNVEAA
jgi:hypothetical protein